MKKETYIVFLKGCQPDIRHTHAGFLARNLGIDGYQQEEVIQKRGLMAPFLNDLLYREEA